MIDTTFGRKVVQFGLKTPTVPTGAIWSFIDWDNHPGFVVMICKGMIQIW